MITPTNKPESGHSTATRWTARGKWTRLAEATATLLLLLGWFLSYWVIQGQFKDLLPGTRAQVLEVWNTKAPLEVGMLLGVVATLSLLGRHRLPTLTPFIAIGSLCAVVYLTPVYASIPLLVSFVIALHVLVYAWYGHKPWLLVPLLGAPLGIMFIELYLINKTFESVYLDSATITTFAFVTGSALTPMGGAAAGLGLRYYSRVSAKLEQQNTQLVDQQKLRTEAVLADERLRISRELHDIVAHHILTMTLHAGAARQFLKSDPKQIDEPLKSIEQAGRSAVNELNQVVGFLRESSSDAVEKHDRETAPTLRNVHRLEKTFSSEVTFDVQTSGDIQTVPPAVDVSAYRIVQESVTNSVKHSSASRIAIRISANDNDIELCIDELDTNKRRNPKYAKGVPKETTRTGHGLLGIKERISLHGGQGQMGPNQYGRWSTAVTLPYRRSDTP